MSEASERYFKEAGCSNNLNRRQMLLAEYILSQGFYAALKLTGYHKIYAYKLMHRPKFKEYQLSLLKGAVKDLNLSMRDMLQKRLNLADDKSTPAKVRDEIYRDLIGILKEVEQEDNMGVMRAHQFLPVSGMKALKPSRELKAENIEEIQEVK